MSNRQAEMRPALVNASAVWYILEIHYTYTYIWSQAKSLIVMLILKRVAYVLAGTAIRSLPGSIYVRGNVEKVAWYAC